jgi:hypothetical protein
MKEINHDTLRYKGNPGEKATIRVTAQGTKHMVNYTLDGGDTQVLLEGQPIEFNLKNTSGQRTDLQLLLQFNAQGSYEIVVENVENCSKDVNHTGKCTRSRDVPPNVILNFKFFVA